MLMGSNSPRLARRALLFGVLLLTWSVFADWLVAAVWPGAPSWPGLGVKALLLMGLASPLFFLLAQQTPENKPAPPSHPVSFPLSDDCLQRLVTRYACLTEINQAMVRCATREELLNAVCQTFVGKTGMVGALVYSWHLPPLTSGVATALLVSLQNRYDDAFAPLVTEIRAGRKVVFNDLLSKAPLPSWPGVFLPLGTRSLAAYPLRQGDKILAAVAVFSDHSDWFDPDMCALLDSLMVDITFCLDHLDQEASRQTAESELRRSRGKLERAEAIAHVGYWERRPDGFVDWSNETFRIFGLEPQATQVSFNALLDMIYPEDRAKVQNAYEQCFAGIAPYDVEYRIQTSDGRLRRLHSQGGLYSQTPEGPTIFGAVLDVTETRQALEALRKSEESLAMAVEAASLGLWDARLADASLSVNGEFAAMLGYRHEEFSGLSYDGMKALVHPDDREPLMQAIRGHIDGRQAYFEVECRLQHQAGHWIWVQGRGRVTEWGEDGQPRRLSGTQIDITDRKESDDLLRLLYRAVEQCPASIVITDIDGSIQYVNRRFTEVTGYRRDEALGKNPRIIKSGNTPDNVYQEMWSTIKAGGTWVGRLENRRKNGDYYWESAIIQGITTERGEVMNFLAIKEDITDRVAAERKIRELQATLEKRIDERTRAMSLAVKDLESFSYSVSHDLRAPLRAITGFSQILLETEAQNLSEEGQALLDRVVINGQRMANLIDDILEYSRAGRSEPRLNELDLSRMARDIAAELSSDYPRAVVNVAELPKTKGDATMLRQVMTNLISNAMKFSCKRSDPLVEVGCREEEGKTVFFVRDNGAGFDMQYASHLFGMFQRLHSTNEFPGTGVGLAIVKRLVERHGGSIWAESLPGQGATFSFTLG